MLCNNWIRPTKSESDLVLYNWICVLVLWIHKGYFVVKKLVLNVCVKAFWYTKWFKKRSIYKINILCLLHTFAFSNLRNWMMSKYIYAFKAIICLIKLKNKNCQTPHKKYNMTKPNQSKICITNLPLQPLVTKSILGIQN